MMKKKILVLQSVVVGYASSLQPASLVVPPCQDIAYHIPNQEDNKVVKKERERNCAIIIITLPLTPH